MDQQSFNFNMEEDGLNEYLLNQIEQELEDFKSVELHFSKNKDSHRYLNFEDDVPVEEMEDLDLNKSTEVDPVKSTLEDVTMSRNPQISPTNTLQRFENYVFDFSLGAGSGSNEVFRFRAPEIPAASSSRFDFEDQSPPPRFHRRFHLADGRGVERSSSIFRPRQSLSHIYSEKVKRKCEMKKLQEMAKRLMLEKKKWQMKVNEMESKLEELKQSC